MKRKLLLTILIIAVATCSCFGFVSYASNNKRIVDELGKLTNQLNETINKLNEKIYVLENENNQAKGVFSVMSYNVGSWYDGTGEVIPNTDIETLIPMQKRILDYYKPDVLCCQEYRSSFGTSEMISPCLLKDKYCNVETYLELSRYDGKAICTNRSLENFNSVNFLNTDGCLRNYTKAYIPMNGRKVCVINTHFATDESLIIAETEEILKTVKNEEYFIICGDFNVDVTDTTTILYQNSIKKFVDNGYKLANGGDFGVFVTFPETNQAIDNIIVSSNINIKSVIVNTQKNDVLVNKDHYPLIAYVEVF